MYGRQKVKKKKSVINEGNVFFFLNYANTNHTSTYAPEMS